MLRFRNPGSNIETQVAIFRALYNSLKENPVFNLAEMKEAITSTPLLTAYGYSGQRAAEITGKRTESLDSAKMNMKMYAELFRLLGWMAPAGPDRKYPLRFTLVGEYAASSVEAAYDLLEQAALGYVNPSEPASGVKYDEHVRFFSATLQSLSDLGGMMFKHELCLGPMSFSDDHDGAYSKMIEKIKALRGDRSRLAKAFEDLASDLGMKPVSVDNMTRFPIGLLRGIGWIETDVRDRTLYNKSLSCFSITEKGLSQLEHFETLADLRLVDYRSLEPPLQKSLIRSGVYSMLERAGFDISPVREDYTTDLEALDSVLKGREPLFSPYQTLHAWTVDQALGINYPTESSTNGTERVETLPPDPLHGLERRNLVFQLTKSSLRKPSNSHTPTKRESAQRLFEKINGLWEQGLSKESIVESMFAEHRSDKQKSFYPLVADLFTLCGFPARESRAGDNGARWDVLIYDDLQSIPIEVKSPSEEMYLSLKAVRQALENKVVLSSRKTHPTTTETTSLVVGYHLPNVRAEVSQLIDEIDLAFGVRVGVVGLEDLLSLAVECVTENVIPERDTIMNLKGLLCAAV